MSLSPNVGANFGINVVNDGVIKSSSPTAQLNYAPPTSFADAVTGIGTIEIGLGSVTADALVGSGQTLQFSAAPSGSATPKLILNDVQEFSGLIAGFDQNGATDDLLVVNTATWQYQDFVANAGGTGGALMFSNGVSEVAVNLAGAYQPNGFHAVVSGDQTTITYAV